MVKDQPAEAEGVSVLAVGGKEDYTGFSTGNVREPKRRQSA